MVPSNVDGGWVGMSVPIGDAVGAKVDAMVLQRQPDQPARPAPTAPSVCGAGRPAPDSSKGFASTGVRDEGPRALCWMTLIRSLVGCEPQRQSCFVPTIQTSPNTRLGPSRLGRPAAPPRLAPARGLLLAVRNAPN